MKSFSITLRTLFSVIFLLFACLFFCSFSSDPLAPGPGYSIEMFSQNWELVLLILSEIMAFLPTKHKGLLSLLLFFLRRVKLPKKVELK